MKQLKFLYKKLQKAIPFNDSIKHTFQSKYGLTEEHLIGDIEGFPLEIIEKMLERQEEQGNKVNVSVFQKYWARKDGDRGGFNWTGTPEGFSFWYMVIFRRDFNMFFEKYPKEV